MQEIDKIMKLVANINLMEKNAINKFSKWKNEDGSLEGLLKKFPYLKNESEENNVIS